jgi:hypothetical protein
MVQTRLAEIVEASSRDDERAMTAALAAYEREIATLGATTGEPAARALEAVASHRAVLERVAGAVPAQARGGLERALATGDKVIDRLSAVEVPGSAGSGGAPNGTGTGGNGAGVGTGGNGNANGAGVGTGGNGTGTGGNGTGVGTGGNGNGNGNANGNANGAGVGTGGNGTGPGAAATPDPSPTDKPGRTPPPKPTKEPVDQGNKKNATPSPGTGKP